MKNKKEMLLTGLRILDLTDQKAAFCSKLLADLGAYVIKVEKPGGDSSRNAGPFKGNKHHPEKSLSFFYNNTGKKGITLNIEHKEGKKIFLALVKKNDVVVESFSPGYLEKQGLGFESLSRINPKIILASVSGFGQAGPKKDYKTCDLVASAFGGQMSVTGSFKPLKHYGEQSYLTASLFAATGILLAVRKRRMTGKGEHLDISIQEAVASTLEHVMIRYFYENHIPKRQGSLHWDNLFHIFRCKDGFIQITLFDKWETFVEWMDTEGMADDLVKQNYLDETYRKSRLDHIIKTIENWTKTHTVKELFELGQLMQFPWAPVDSPQKVVKSPQLKARGFFKDTCPTRKAIVKKCPGLPYQFDRESKQAVAKAPLIGEHNLGLYRKELGLSKERLEELSSMGII
jgi:crotonobetainyl-CoA:carnitine CoA-transferase CaiB-like acyl-CoA transferase